MTLREQAAFLAGVSMGLIPWRTTTLFQAEQDPARANEEHVRKILEESFAGSPQEIDPDLVPQGLTWVCGHAASAILAAAEGRWEAAVHYASESLALMVHPLGSDQWRPAAAAIREFFDRNQAI